jgi:hypothetical protein
MQVKRERVEETGREAITVSQDHEDSDGGINLSNHRVNQLVSGLLVHLAEALAKEDEYEFDGIGEPSFDDKQISITANLFVP